MKIHRRLLFGIVGLLAFASQSVSAQQSWNPNVFGGANFDNGVVATPNVFGGYNYSNGVTSTPNEQQDLNREVPLVFMLTFQGLPIPDFDSSLSADFVLGQLWARAQQDAHDRSYDAKSNPTQDAKVAKIIAQNAFSTKNCGLM